jgi:hypothetical protein
MDGPIGEEYAEGRLNTYSGSAWRHATRLTGTHRTSPLTAH